VTSPEEAAEAVGRSFRRDRHVVLATLIRLVGSFDVAEDALQEAFTAALESWPQHGVPANPGGWLAVTAKRRAIDRLRRDRAQVTRAENLAVLARLQAQEDDVPMDADSLLDDQVRLIFTCCHPALDMPARVALTLRTVGGLSTGEIARAFLVAEPTMGKRIVRAKRKIAEAHIPYTVPGADELPERLAAVLSVIYLIFNEGYLASAGDSLLRADLTREAIRLAGLVRELTGDEPEAWGLLALLLLTDARRAARVDARGRFVALPAQDRTRWDRRQIAAGLDALDRAVRHGRPGPYLLQAAIAALQSTTDGELPWPEIAALYDTLYELDPSPVVAVNRSVAAGFAYGPQAGLALLLPLLDEPALVGYQPLYAAVADLRLQAGDPTGAAMAYERAIELSGNTVERGELQRRLGGIGPPQAPTA
jgi:RNA polymerase sigma-70 factor (ECF subfamily)